VEAVNHPAHYGGDSTYEAIKVIEAWGLDRDFCLGSAVKYISRAGKKNPDLEIEDLRKAVWYCERAIQQRVDAALQARDLQQDSASGAQGVQEVRDV
jgi:2-methylcitrate dehydratase PrpD